MLYTQGETSALTSFLGLQQLQGCLGSPEEEEWSFVLPLPRGEGSEIKGQELLLPEGRKAINWLGVGGAQIPLEKSSLIRPWEKEED